MPKLEDHPSVVRFRQSETRTEPGRIDIEKLRRICLDAGADDVGFVAIDRQELDDQRAEILGLYPWTKGLISIVCRMNREPVRSPARSVANLEFHNTGHEVDAVASGIVTALEVEGIRAVNPAMGFPMEMGRFPDKIWVVSHKPVAVAAGLGQMGIHRNVIHPKFGNFILLGTVLVEAEIPEQSRPIDYNPCLSCKLCVAACPVGAIGPDGHFDFTACLTHNYREFLGGFTDWVEQVADSKDALDYRRRVEDSETVSVWQSLSFGPNYKAAYCMAACPAGDDIIGPFLTDRKGFLKEVVTPLQEKVEPVYVVPGSDAEAYVSKRFPHKRPRRVGGGRRLRSIRSFLSALPHAFQRHASEGLEATYHFTFTGEEAAEATVVIRDKTIRVEPGHVGTPNLRIAADSMTWLGFLAKERNLAWALVRRKIRLKGSPRFLVAFGRCFPS
ncbi:MAG: SCP2 sterol-binding domain-containing protein [Paludisphaera borealis]|uniref:4Fe-4S binding protein n=1 Tax=Paludisphaera borealis TaxID=1387353 RepID=UPI00283DE315|nr:SCP2 sterol-binding domain-containing protein [Paludisphaera borealis]MDR3619230.1 SCP2 sterol-binding domain-containing protein [Paludisphaera borealis]